MYIPEQFRFAAEAVQHIEMLFRPQQNLIVMLPVDIDQRLAERTQQRRRCGFSVDSADTAAVRRDFARQQQFIILRIVSVFRQDGSGIRGERGEQRCDDGLFAARPDEILIGALPEDSPNPVNQNRLTCAGLTGKRIEAAFERNDSGFDDSKIFN